MAIKLLIADEHAYIQMALEGLFAGTDDITVVATCTDGDEVASTAARTEPDVVLMDLDMPRMNGLDATRKLLAAQPHVRVLVLTG
ncbi:MAG TPA: response regulator transcription factor, partial [Blastococcus sp.]